MSKYTVHATTENPAYSEGRKMWKAVIVIMVIIAIATIL